MSESIVFRSPNWLGDAVMATVVPKALRRAYPDARITVLAPRAVVDVFSQAPEVDEVRGFERGGEVDAYRAGRYDFAVLGPTSFGCAWRAFRGGVRRRFGFATERRGVLLTTRLPGREYRRDRHQVENYRVLAGLAGEASPEDSPEVHLADAWRSEARTLWSATNRRVAIHAGASYGPAKRWLPERFAGVIDALVRDGASVALLGGPGDREAVDAVRSAVTTRVLDLSGRTTIGTLGAVLAEADLLISNDTGPMHLAAAVGTPTVAIFGSTNPVWTRPYGPRTRVVRHEVPCSPCYLRVCKIGYLCMQGISESDVLGEVHALREAERR
jgi:heptosyltransferase-2